MLIMHSFCVCFLCMVKGDGQVLLANSGSHDACEYWTSGDACELLQLLVKVLTLNHGEVKDGGVEDVR